MEMLRTMGRPASLLVALAMLLLQIAPLQAAMIETNTLLQAAQSEYQRDQLVELLTRDEVQGQLVALGVAPDEVVARVAAMSDQEIVRLNRHIEDLPAGGDGLGLVIFLFVLFIITDMLGATDIFPFVDPIR